MVVIFKHQNQNFILNSDDIVNISNILTCAHNVIYFQIALKTNYIHTFNFELPLFDRTNAKKMDFLLDEHKIEVTKAIQAYKDQDRYTRRYSDREFDFIIKDHHYDVESYKRKIKEDDELLAKHHQKINEIRNKIQSKIDNLIKELYPDIESKVFIGEIDLSKN